jgi:hypothetical protein
LVAHVEVTAARKIKRLVCSWSGFDLLPALVRRPA